MCIYSLLFEEFVIELGFEEIEINELGYGVVIIDKIWVVYLVFINEKELVVFMWVGILIG